MRELTDEKVLEIMQQAQTPEGVNDEMLAGGRPRHRRRSRLNAADRGTEQRAAGTPSSRWSVNGEPDPHGTRYNCERTALSMGNLTDDELANGAFMNYDAPFDPHGIIAGTSHSPIAWMTAVKDRIRWLSRRLENVAPADRDVMRQAPEGWKWVPIEPTDVMIRAACDDQEYDPEDSAESEAYCFYKAMLAASPTLPVEPLGDDELSPAYKTPDELIAALDSDDAPPAEQQGTLTSVTKEDANKYCLILRELGMEEEGDPVAEVMRLKRLAEQGEQEPRPAFSKDALWGMKHALAKLRAKVEALQTNPMYNSPKDTVWVRLIDVLEKIDKLGGKV